MSGDRSNFPAFVQASFAKTGEMPGFRTPH